MKKPLSTWRAWAADSAVIALMLTIGAICAVAWRPSWDDVIKEDSPRSIEALHPAIIHAGRQGGQHEPLEIRLQGQPLLDDGALVYGFADDALLVAKGLKHYFPESLSSTVKFTVHWAEYGLGEPATEMLSISLHLAAASLRSLEVEGDASPQDLLNMTLAVSYDDKGDGKNLVRAFCAEPYAQSAASFCKRENV